MFEYEGRNFLKKPKKLSLLGKNILVNYVNFDRYFSIGQFIRVRDVNGIEDPSIQVKECDHNDLDFIIKAFEDYNRMNNYPYRLGLVVNKMSVSLSLHQFFISL